MFKKLDETDPQKNFKLMILSASILVALFIYTTIKSNSIVHNSNYIYGIGFLLILMTISFYMQKYKEKVRKLLNKKTAFQEELQKANAEENNTTSTTDVHLEAITSNITFNDIAGIESIKEELEEVVDFLNNPKKYQKYGVQLPKGVLLVGPPGVGKTLIAKAVAGEADVPFFYQSGASFVHIYVGMGAKRVKELFTKARTLAPAIIFIDEIDAIGKSRDISSNDEREATLNELLTQMDGFDATNGVIVIGATNKIEVLDDALLRAGRFDRRVFVSLPSYADRIKILQLYTKNKNINFNMEELASSTSGFNSAALATLINEALLNMIKRGGTSLIQTDIDTAKQKVQYGKKQLNILCADQKEILSIYQASKAFISQQKVSLFDEGFTQDDCTYPSKTQLEQRIKNNLAGSIGLEVIKNEPYAVFKSEIQKANDIAKQMVNDFQMATSQEDIIKSIKQELKETIKNNITQIDNLSQIMQKDEVIVF